MLPDGRVEVRGKDESASVYLCAWALAEQLEAEEVAVGDTVVVCPLRKIAFALSIDQFGWAVLAAAHARSQLSSSLGQSPLARARAKLWKTLSKMTKDQVKAI